MLSVTPIKPRTTRAPPEPPSAGRYEDTPTTVATAQYLRPERRAAHTTYRYVDLL